MLSQREYNKIIHDWIVTLTGLNGSNVRPQKDAFGFALVDVQGKPIAFDSTICMFYFTLDDAIITKYYKNVDTVQSLKSASVLITVVGDSADQVINQIQSLCMSSKSKNYLYQYGFAIDGDPIELQNDKEYSKKWFYRRTVTISLNVVVEFTPPETPLSDDIVNVPLTVNKK